MVTIFTNILNNGSWADTFLHEDINLLEPEFYIYILSHPVGKMRIILTYLRTYLLHGAE